MLNTSTECNRVAEWTPFGNAFAIHSLFYVILKLFSPAYPALCLDIACTAAEPWEPCIFLTQPNSAALCAAHSPGLSLQLHSWNCSPSGTAHSTLPLLRIKAFWYLSRQPKLMTGWEKSLLIPLPHLLHINRQSIREPQGEYDGCAEERGLEGSTLPSWD